MNQDIINLHDAFNNNTNATRYSKEAADLAWKRTLEFFNKHLK
jgi:carboxymethylenebutenolidase